MGGGTRQVHTVDYGAFIKSQLAYMQLTSGACVVQSWSRKPQNVWGNEILELHRVAETQSRSDNLEPESSILRRNPPHSTQLTGVPRS